MVIITAKLKTIISASAKKYFLKSLSFISLPYLEFIAYTPNGF